MRRSVVGIVASASALALALASPAFGIGTVTWTRLLGSAGAESIAGAATDSTGNLFVVGTTDGALPGAPIGNVGVTSAFVASYTQSGALRWTNEIGSAGATTSGSDIAVDGNGVVYVTGTTDGTLPGARQSNAGGTDVFLARYSNAGSAVWTRLIGGPGADSSAGVALDPSGNPIVAGSTTGLAGLKTVHHEQAAFVASYTSSNHKRWLTLWGGTQPKTQVSALDVRSDCLGDSYIGGAISGRTRAAYVTSFDDSGAVRWSDTLYSSRGSLTNALATDCAGNVYASGTTLGPHPAGQRGPVPNGFLVRLAEDGTSVWQELFKDSGNYYPESLVADPAKSVVYGVGEADLPSARYVVFDTATGADVTGGSLSGDGTSNLRAGALDPSGNLDTAGWTNNGQPGSPDTYAGGATDALLFQVSDPTH